MDPTHCELFARQLESHLVLISVLAVRRAASSACLTAYQSVIMCVYIICHLIISCIYIQQSPHPTDFNLIHIYSLEEDVIRPLRLYCAAFNSKVIKEVKN